MHFWFYFSEKFWKNWPQVEKNGKFLRFYIPKYLANVDVIVHALAGNKSGGFCSIAQKCV